MMPPAPPVSFWNVYSTVRVLGRAPPASSALTTAAWFSVAASISAVWPRNFSRGVDVGARLEQQLDDVDVAGSRRDHQRRFAFAIRRVGLGAGAKQRADHCRVADVAASCSGVTP